MKTFGTLDSGQCPRRNRLGHPGISQDVKGHLASGQCPRRDSHLTTLEGFTTMVANKGLEKAEPMDPGTDGFTSPPKDVV